MRRSFVPVLLAFIFITPAFARVDLLLVPPVEAVAPGAPIYFTLYLNNPTADDETFELPSHFEAEYASLAGHRHATLVPDQEAPLPRRVAAMSRTSVRLRIVEAGFAAPPGFVSLRLTEPASNAVMFELGGAPQAATTVAAATPPAPARSTVAPSRQLDLSTDVESMRRHISAYDPIYFAVGSRDRLNARFQFSFKYRVFEPAPVTAPFLEQLLREIYGAYTQTSIWDLESFSKPFYDSSYQPTVFVLHEFRDFPADNGLMTVQAGAQHESNGRGGGGPGQPVSDSRSINSFYIAPKIRWTRETGLFFEVGTRASTYLNIDENPELPRYRGYVELTFRGGYDRGFQMATHLRGHPEGHGSIEFNLSWPAIETPLLKRVFPRSLGGYAQIQYFNGYGESLLDYDVRRRDQLRFGIMLAR